MPSLLPAALMLLSPFILTNLQAVAQEGYSYVPVTDITDVPVKATVGTPLVLTGTVVPDNATNKTIIWSVRNPGATGATIEGNILSATAAGTVDVTATIENDAVASAATGEVHTAVVKTDGTLWVWGDNWDGQLGVGTDVEFSYTPVQVGSGKNWKTVAAGGYHTVALKTDGTLWAWGWNADGKLGIGTDEDSYTPVQVGLDNDWASVAAGYEHTVALKTDGSLWAWGSNFYGQLGVDTNLDNCIYDYEKDYWYCPVPIQVGSNKNWALIAAGDSHTVALEKDGSLWAWGANWDGQLGIGENNDSCLYDYEYEYCPVPVQVGSDKEWATVAAGFSHTVALKTDGALLAWGRNDDGQLGTGANHVSCVYNELWGYWYCPIPVQVGSDKDWAAVVAGGAQSLALKTGGTLWAWGDNSYGQLGDDTGISSNTPVMVGLDDNWAFISTNYGSYHTMAVRKDGSLWAWGANWYGQLGDGTDEDSYAPILITVPVDSTASYTRDFTIEVKAAIIYGDANGDGAVNMQDLTVLAQYLARWPGIVIDEMAADANGDGAVNMQDLTVLSRHLARWPGYEILPYIEPAPAAQIMPVQAALMSARSAVPAINVSSASGNVGDIVDVNIGLSGNPGIIAMRLGVEFDNTVLRLVGVIDKGNLGIWYHRNVYDTSPYTLLWENGVSPTNLTYNGDIVTMRFEILSKTAGSPVTVTYSVADRDIFDFYLRAVYFEVNNGSISTPAAKKAVTLVGAVPSASVKKLNGNKNELTVAVTESFSDSTTNIIKETFLIDNNAAGSYRVGSYVVYVDTKGNDQIRQCYIVK